MSAAPRRELPEAEEHWLLGSAGALAAAPHRFPAEIGRRHGGLARFRVLHKRFVAVTDPLLVEQILVARPENYRRSYHYDNMQAVIGCGLLSTDGEDWQQRRRLIAPLFRNECLRRVAAVAASAAMSRVEHWETLRRRNETVPIVAEMRHLTMSVIGQALLSTELTADEALRFSQAVQDALHLLRRRNTGVWNAPLWLPTPHNRRLRQTRDILDRFLRARLAARGPDGDGEPNDLAQALASIRNPEDGAPLPRQALLDELKTLFVAGFETTSAALAWTLHLLARHPEVAAAWHAEIDDVLRDELPTWEHLKRLTWTDQIIHEALRRYPPVYNLVRTCVNDDELGGYAIPRGSLMLASVYGIQRSPEWWPDPLAFRPERFAPGTDWPRQAFLPFGAGKHTCIGLAFSLIEMKAALAVIGRRYRLESGDDRPVEECAEITLCPAREIFLRLVPRP